MWMSTFARFATQAVTRAVACQALRPHCRPGKTPGHLTSCLTSVPHRRLQTVVPASQLGSLQVVRHVRALNEERLVEVEWEDGDQSLYPFTWLRDNCQCPLCTLQSAQARELLMRDLDIHTGVDTIKVTNDNKVSVVWPDQHISVFDPEWLKKRCFSSAARQSMREELFLNGVTELNRLVKDVLCLKAPTVNPSQNTSSNQEPTLHKDVVILPSLERYYWGSDLNIPTIDFHEVLHDDKATLDWLLTLRRVGVVCLKGAPVELGQVARLSERIGYHRLTFYGHTWQVQDKEMANNVAYTSKKLSVHTDYPALGFPPGVQFVHCLCAAMEGGESQLVDGFHVTQQLQREDPEAFQALTSLKVNFTDTGTDFCDFHLKSRHNIISVDDEGRVDRINWNNATRDSVLDLPLHQVQPLYRALKVFTDMMDRAENVVLYSMEPGDVMTFDNWRILHGRKSYVSRPHFPRHLEGAYLDWDEVMSRLRILHGSLKSNS